ncbi:MAG: hypothetical protein DRP08_08055 [Candidatus Aenigmatarchaeota archaeon]|nr:MAG: hypothetical protein DRP08_08055 [Candidatus Aenigmarchaeota archaeon]
MKDWTKEFDEQWANRFLDSKYIDDLKLRDKVKAFFLEWSEKQKVYGRECIMVPADGLTEAAKAPCADELGEKLLKKGFTYKHLDNLIKKWRGK